VRVRQIGQREEEEEKIIKRTCENIKSSLIKEQGSETLSWRTEQFWWTLFKGRN